MFNRTRSLTGRALFLTGIVDNEEASFSIAVSEKRQKKFGFAIGDQINGAAWTKQNPNKQIGAVYDEGWLDDIYTENREMDD